jgi:soluble lytic murein transglycosylase-like protein
VAANNIYIQVDFNSQNAQQNVNALNQSIATTGPTAEKSSKQATSGLQSIGVSIQQVNREFSQLAAAFAGLGVSRAIAGMVQMSAELSRTQAAMESFTGSAQEANKVFEEIRAVAAQSPFRFKDLEETAQRLMGFGLAAKNVPDTLKVITDQVARMGGTIEGVNTIVNLFGRVMEKNFVGAMDLTRALPAQGVPALKALGAELERIYGQKFDVERTRNAIKEGILDPLQTVRVILESMRQKGDASRFSDDAARAFKNLADTVDNVLGKLFGPSGFGPALTKLANQVSTLLAPLGGLVDMLMKLPEHTKETILQVTAAAAAFAVFGTALGIVTSLTSPLLGLIGAIGKFTISLATMNPELALTAVLLGGLGYAAYKLIPQVKAFTDNLIGPLVDKIKNTLSSLALEGRKFFADAFKGGTPIDLGALTNTDALFQKLKDEEQKHAYEAQRTLLEALASPVEAVRLKYATLFSELEEKIKNLKEDQKTALREILGGAENTETAAAAFKENKKQLDELTRYQVERAKGAADAQVAYIEAQDAQDLRSKVRNYDQITQIRIDAANEVGNIEKNNLRDQFQTFVEMVDHYRADFAKAGIDVDNMIESHRRELLRQQTMIDQKAFDESQKYRLEGHKKVNDAIIEDQKRVYDAFKDQFSQLFDVFTDKSKSLGQALGDFLKKSVIGEARQLFSSAMAGAATQAAGYGRPEESVSRGGQGILGVLLRRGMPPRPPMPPPELQQIPEASSGISFPMASSMKGSAQRFEISTDAYSVATIRFAEAVNNFAAGASVQRFGSADRAADPNTTMNEAFQQASGATGVPQPLLRAVAQAESSMNPRAVSPAGAMGLMQLMPRTAAGLGVTQPFDVGQNVMGGAQHLQEMLTRYHGNVPLALAAYNMGATALDKRLASGRALPQETQQYVARITRLMAAAPEAAGVPGAADVVSAEDARFIRATGGAAPPVTFEQLANLPTHQQPFLLPGLPSFGGGGGLTGPSVAELASLPQGPSTMQRLAPFLAPLMGGALKAGGATAGGGGVGAFGLPKLSQLGEFFGIYGKGITNAGTILTSPAVGMLASLGGMALASRGLQQRNAAATSIGGGLAGGGYVLSNPALMARMSEMPGGALGGIGAGVAAGAGLGLFASGFQRGGGSGLAMDVGGGALAGAGIGWMAGGPLGAAIGAGIGAAAGAITGIVRLFVHTEQERIRTGIKQVYGIDISNRQILTQIQQIVDQKYGGSVTIGIRSQEVQDIVRLYALSTGQAANLPRPMYAATIAQSQAGGLATQPVYQGGVLVQNPYTGPTTYQYQTAVTAAQGLMAGTSQGTPGAGGQVSNIFMQLNPQQANDLFTGRVVQAVQQNPAAVASANASATRSGDSRVSQASNMLEPLTSLG